MRFVIAAFQGISNLLWIVIIVGVVLSFLLFWGGLFIVLFGNTGVAIVVGVIVIGALVGIRPARHS